LLANEWGLVHTISDDADQRAHAFASKIALQPPTAIANTKALLKSRTHDAVSAVIAAEAQLFSIALQSDEAREAFMRLITMKT